MKKIRLRMVSFALSLCLLLGSVSCSVTPAPIEEQPENTLHFTVIQVPAVYTNEAYEAYAARITSLSAKVVYRVEGLVLSETQLQKLSQMLCTELLPMLESIPVYPEELEMILDSAESIFEEAEEGPLLLWFRFYQSNLTTLGSTRAGKLGYLAADYWLETREATFRARYEKYGYSWYLEDAEHYAALSLRIKEELGADCFCAAAEILTFAASTLWSGLSSLEGEGGGFGLSAGELRAILARGAREFASVPITESQWSLVGELLAEAIPSRRDTALTAELDALAADGYFARAARCMPLLLETYRAATEAMTVEDAAAIFYGDDENARRTAVCRALNTCKSTLASLLQAFEAFAATASEAETRALTRLGELEACQSLLTLCGNADAEQLLAQIEACAQEGTAESGDAVVATLRAYLATYIPYLLYALQGVGKETTYANGNGSL